MNEINSSKLEQISNDKLMIQALKCLFNDKIEKELPEVEEHIDNRLIGEKYRSYTVARDVLEGVLKDIETYKDNKTSPNSFNKGL